jgi:hypothetical protein
MPARAAPLGPELTVRERLLFAAEFAARDTFDFGK